MKCRVILVTSILLMNVLFLLPSLIFTPVKALDYRMDHDLGVVNASFLGESEGDNSGYSVTSAGDVNGDGYDDILIGGNGGNKNCIAYLVFGKASGWAMDTKLTNSDASFRAEKESNYHEVSVARAGDVNGDGYDDILIGVKRDDEGGRGAGQTYLIFGKTSGWSTDTDLSTSDASFWGEGIDDYSGCSVAGAGDVNGDGYDDVLIGAKSSHYTGQVGKSHTYLVFGRASGWTMDTSLSNSDASFLGEGFGSHSRGSIAGAGDVNGDGYDDILISSWKAYGGGSYGNQTYLILGKVSGWAMYSDLSYSDASFWKKRPDDLSRMAVAGAGDVNGDGYDDILIGASQNSTSGDSRGQTYLIFGKPSDWFMETDLSTSDASFRGEAQKDYSGKSVSGAGDINGDGYDDIIIGAPSDTIGKIYIILGKSSGWTKDTGLSSSDASFWGERERDYSRISIAGAGDVNGDGYDDILIGEPDNEEGGSRAGQTYLIFADCITESLLYGDTLALANINTCTNITFTIMYKEGDGAANVELVVDGNRYSMESDDSTSNDLIKGVQYSYTFHLTEGIHRYHYSVSDGKSTIKFPEVGNLTIQRSDTYRDSDGDGYNDSHEREVGSSPYNETSIPHDWDGDGWNNSIETEMGVDPRDHSSYPSDLDGDMLPDSIDPDRDGDSVPNVDDTYPDDPYRYGRDNTFDHKGYMATLKWTGSIVLALVIVMVGVVIYVGRKKKCEEYKESDTDDRGRIG